MQNNILTIHTDGGSRGNPGPAACAFVSEINGNVLEKKSKYLNVTTNNVAEYEGVVLALEWFLINKDKIECNEIHFLLDSELVVKQLTGLYKIKKFELQQLSLKIKKSIADINKKIVFRNVPREENKTADSLVNKELDSH